MATTRYHNWSDSRDFIDTAAWGEPDPAQTQRLAVISEVRFENAVRRHMDLPLVKADSPEAFEQARQICSLLTAAEYIRSKSAAEGQKDGTWRADQLEAQANALINDLISRHKPTDASDPEAALQYIPYDGGTTARDERVATFGRDNLSGGSTVW